jgi:hypothetical protein
MGDNPAGFAAAVQEFLRTIEAEEKEGGER